MIFSFMYCSHVFPQIMKDWKLISTHFTLFSSSCTLSMCLFSFIITQNCWNLVNCHDKIIVHIDSSYFQTSSWPFVSYLQISNFGTFSFRTSPYYQQQQIDIWFWNWDIWSVLKARKFPFIIFSFITSPGVKEGKERTKPSGTSP